MIADVLLKRSHHRTRLTDSLALKIPLLLEAVFLIIVARLFGSFDDFFKYRRFSYRQFSQNLAI